MMERLVDLHTNTDGSALTAALAGDPDAFRGLTDRYARELHLHCYRMLGSFHDAEDAMQETLLRAWRHLATFEGRSSFRAWLYRIATNVCLRMGRRRQTDRTMYRQGQAEAGSYGAEPAIRLSPYPDALLDELEAIAEDPVAEYDLRESVQLAFLAAVQLLPPRQRAVLLLRDVLGWSAEETAALLESTTASVNGALNRARTTLERQRAAGRIQTGQTVPTDDREQSVVRRYIEAWDAVDIGKLAGLLKSDVVVTMPPSPLCYRGREAAVGFFAAFPAGGALDRFRHIPTRANRRPAVALYRRDPGHRTYRARGIVVLRVEDEALAEITAFVDPLLMPVFGLPTELSDDSGAVEMPLPAEQRRR
jgi:RNA polymerase sigma-70 factor (ECF subfamily)